MKLTIDQTNQIITLEKFCKLTELLEFLKKVIPPQDMDAWHIQPFTTINFVPSNPPIIIERWRDQTWEPYPWRNTIWYKSDGVTNTSGDPNFMHTNPSSPFCLEIKT